MSVTHKSRAGISERKDQRASEIAVQAIAQAQRQVEFEREHIAYVKRTALEELRQSEARILTLQKHIQELRELADEHQRLAA